MSKFIDRVKNDSGLFHFDGLQSGYRRGGRVRPQLFAKSKRLPCKVTHQGNQLDPLDWLCDILIGLALRFLRNHNSIHMCHYHGSLYLHEHFSRVTEGHRTCILNCGLCSLSFYLCIFGCLGFQHIWEMVGLWILPTPHPNLSICSWVDGLLTALRVQNYQEVISTKV